MALENKIGDFTFLALAGPPKPPTLKLAVYARAGTPGVQLVSEAVRGEPFQLVSAVDAEDLAAARAKFAEYCGVIGAGAIVCKWAGLDMTAENFRVVVLDVQPRVIRSLTLGVGGINPPSRGWLEAEWTVIAVAVAGGP